MRGHIRHRGGDSYEVRYYVGLTPEGKKHYKTETFHGKKKDAENRLADILSGLNQGTHVVPGKDTVAQYLRRWLQEIKPNIRPRTYEWYEMNCRLYLIPDLGSTRLSKLTALQIQKMFRKLLTEGRTIQPSEIETFEAAGREGKKLPPPRRKPLSISSTRGVYATLHAALEQAKKWRLLAQNTAEGVKLPRPEKKEQKILAPQEVRGLLKETEGKGTMYHALYSLTAGGGIRQGEALGLRWQDLDLENKTATLNKQLQRIKEPPPGAIILRKAGKRTICLADTKTDESKRTITLPDSVVEALKTWATEAKEERQAYEGEEQEAKGDKEQEANKDEYQNFDLVFHVPGGGPINPRNLVRQYKSVLKNAQLSQDVKFHGLRHTHATVLFEAGTNIKEVQRRLGHTDIKTTGNTYTHPVKEVDVRAAQDYDRMIFGQKEEPKPEGKSGWRVKGPAGQLLRIKRVAKEKPPNKKTG